MTSVTATDPRGLNAWATPGVFWLAVTLAGAAFYFADGLDALFAAWAEPEYSHGPLIPVLSGLIEHGERARAWRVASTVINLMLGVLLLVALCRWRCVPWACPPAGHPSTSTCSSASNAWCTGMVLTS